MKDLIIYFDMDGVMADWEAKWLSHFPEITLDILNANPETRFIQKVKDIPKFWEDIPFIPEVMPLWNYCYGKYDVQILSSPLREDIEVSTREKEIWLDRYLGEYEFKRNFVLPECKQEFACPNGLLIDDRDRNVEQFREQGGMAILHEPYNSPRTLSELHSLGF